ncbi:MAG: SMR family transporter [Pseudomonadota bacterium]
MAWVFVVIAVVANVATNLLLKKAMTSMSGEGSLVLEALSSPWLWGGILAGLVLLGSYLMAIRELDLSISYAVVTAAALIGVTLMSALLFEESLTAMKGVGVVLIIVGIAALSQS